MKTREADYMQQLLFPPSLEDWIGKDDPARFIREVVEQLDMKTEGFEMPELKTGAPPYAPELLLRVWLYGYWKGIRSCRKLELACRETIPFVWLSGNLQPDHNTLWRFFQANKKAIHNFFKTTVKSAVQLGMVEFVLQAIDGTKIQAVCSGYGSYNQEHLEKKLNKLDGQIEAMEKEIETANQEEKETAAKLPEELRKQTVLREKVQKALEVVKAESTNYCHPQEPEARRIKQGPGTRFGYNAQITVDEKSSIIVAAEVTQAEEDSGLLSEMIERAEEISGQPCACTVADGGYANSKELAKAEKAERLVLTPLPPSSQNTKQNAYHASEFQYDKENDVFVCPEGKEIPFRRERIKNKRSGNRVREYRSAEVCADCPVRSICTRDRHGRSIELIEGYESLNKLRDRLEDPENRKLLKKRGRIVELSFAWIKQIDGFRRWTLRGLDNARQQWSMICAVRNMKQIFKVWKASREGEKSTPVFRTIFQEG